MKKVLITGSEGFVGQHLVNELKNNYSVIGLSRNTELTPEDNVIYEMGDILDQDRIFNLLKQYSPDIIIHLAGIAKTWGNDPKQVFDINLYGTLNIYEAVKKLRSETRLDPKIIFISSAESYGNTTDPTNITEDAATLPINTYGSSKLAADRLSYQYSQTDKLNIIILRPFPHIGPGQQKGFFVPDMVSQIVELEKNPDQNEILVGNLQSTRDYLDVRDVVLAYKTILETDIKPGEVFNVCSGKGIKVADILEKLIKLAKKEIKVVADPPKLRPVDMPIFVGNNQKLKRVSGWEQNYTLDVTLRDVMEYWREKQ